MVTGVRKFLPQPAWGRGTKRSLVEGQCRLPFPLHHAAPRRGPAPRGKLGEEFYAASGNSSAASERSSSTASAIEAAAWSGPKASFSTRTKVDVVEAEEAEQGAQVRLLAVHRGGGAGAVETGPALDHDRLLALEQALGAGFRVAEGDPGAGDVVEPGLERRGHSEIVHRSADDDDVRRLQLRDQSVGEGDRVAGGVGLGLGAADRGGGLGGEVRDGVRADVAADDPDRAAAAQGRLQLAGQAAGHGRFAGRGAVDDENVGHGFLLNLQEDI